MNIYVKLAEFSIIETKRLLLRPFDLKDAEDMFDYSGNPENLKFVFCPRICHFQKHVFQLLTII